MSAFDKVIGYESIKMELIRYADVLKNSEKYSRLGVVPMSGILLSGRPGLGKTLLAKCFIEEAGWKCFVLRKEKPNGSFVNEIRKTYEKAKEEAPSIIFLDDMDKFSNSDCEYKDTEEYVTIQSCIDEYKGLNIFTLATINEIYRLPDSLRRVGRFDEIIEVIPPSGKNAEEIIEHYLKQKKAVGDIDVKELSLILDSRTCAELETIINKAGIYAGFANRDRICHQDVIDAFVRMLYESPECINPENERENMKIAIHEAGHAVVSEVLEPGSVTLVSVCRNSWSTQGVTNIHKPDDFNLSKELQEHEVIRTLGGRAATEILLGIADVGCSSDLEEAHYQVDEFVDNLGTLGLDTHTRRDSSAYICEKRDQLITSELERYYKIAKQIIVENRDFVEKMRDELLKQKTLTFRDIEKIRKELEEKRG